MEKPVRTFSGSGRTAGGLDFAEKAKELIRLARDQGHLTYEDVNDSLSEDAVTPEDLDRVLTKLRNLDIEISTRPKWTGPDRRESSPKMASVSKSWMIRSGCTCGRWARFLC